MPGMPWSEARLEMPTICPRRRLIIPGRTAAIVLATPSRLTATRAEKTSGRKSSDDVRPPMPALAIRRSTGPSLCSSVLTFSCIFGASVTSQIAQLMGRFSRWSSAVRERRPSCWRSTAAMATPARDSEHASARPRPLPAPVMSATFVSGTIWRSPFVFFRSFGIHYVIVDHPCAMAIHSNHGTVGVGDFALKGLVLQQANVLRSLDRIGDSTPGDPAHEHRADQAEKSHDLCQQERGYGLPGKGRRRNVLAACTHDPPDQQFSHAQGGE